MTSHESSVQYFDFGNAMENVEKQLDKEEIDEDLYEVAERCRNSMFKQVQEVSHLVVGARLQAREADIRARYAAEYAERALSEAQSAHAVAVSLAKTSRVVASMALDFVNNHSFDTSGDGDFLNFSFPESASSLGLQSGDSSGSTSFELSFTSPVIGMNVLRNPRRRSPPKLSPVSSAPCLKHEATYPDDLSPEDSLSDMLNGSKSLPTVWEESYSNGWESTPEPWADKKHTLQMLRKLQSRRENKQKGASKDEDGIDDKDEGSDIENENLSEIHDPVCEINDPVCEIYDQVCEINDPVCAEEHVEHLAEPNQTNCGHAETQNDIKLESKDLEDKEDNAIAGTNNDNDTKTDGETVNAEDVVNCELNQDKESSIKSVEENACGNFTTRSSADDVYKVNGFGLDTDIRLHC